MPFRPPLDLTSIMEQHATRPVVREEEPERLVALDDGFCFSREPVRKGAGPDVWSTSTALVPVEFVCADVNGYYRELGVDWRATRKELAVAYMAVGGMGSPRLTYVFKQLLNPKVREEYDKTRAGEPFFDDYTVEELKRRAADEAGRRSLMGQTISVDEIIDEWGYVSFADDEVDSVSPMREDRYQRPELPWTYSYYAWKTTSYLQDEKLLRQWQELLSTAASRCGVAPQLALGLTAVSDQPFMMKHVGNKPVVFFTEGAVPDISIAEKVVEHLLRTPSDPQSPIAESGAQ